MYLTLIAAAAMWGAAAGLLVPRAAYRLSVEPDEPWRAACPAGHPLAGPARGWLGRAVCTRCAARVGSPAGSPADAAGRGGAGTATAVRWAGHGHVVVTVVACASVAAATGARPELGVWLLIAPFAVLLALVDHEAHRLPDLLTLPLAAVTAVLLGAAALLPEHAGSWPGALLGGLVLGCGYFVLFLINPNGMGFGDVKLALTLGLVLGWYGWPVLFIGAFAGFMLGSLYGLGLVLLRRVGRKSAIAFGPFMICGALLGLLYGGAAV